MPPHDDGRFLDLFRVRPSAARSRFLLNAPIHLVFLALVLLIGIGGWTARRHVRLLYEQQVEVAATQRQQAQLQLLLSTALDAETGVRGYVATGQEGHLEPYRSAAASFDARLAELDAMSAGDAAREGVALQLGARGRAHLEHLDRIVASASDGDRETALADLRAGDGKLLMDGIRGVVEAAADSEHARLRANQERARASYRLAELTGLMVAVAGVFLIVVLYHLILRFESLRTRSTLEIEEARERFGVALGSIGDAVLVTDADGRLAYCNDGCRSMLRLGDTDIGRPLEDLIRSLGDGSTGLYEGLVERARLEAGTHRTAQEVGIRLTDGASLQIEATAARLRAQGDRGHGVVLVLRDVTGRRERERELARSHERFRSLVLATSQIVWTTDREGRVREDSPSWRAYTGQTYEQWRGLGWLDALHPDDRESTLRAWQEAVRERRLFAGEYRLRRADGAFRWNMVRGVPVADADGAVREWVGMNQDIEELKQSETARREASRRKDEFIALLAHELRNPLAPLRNGLALVKSGEAADAARALEMMERQVAHIVRLIDDLLDVSRISQGKFELRKQSVDLRAILFEAVDTIGPVAWSKRQDLRVDLPESPLWVHGDPVRLLQVFSNLLNNAVKYSGKAANIWLSAEREGQAVLVSVRDTGQGIAPELLPRIWDLFLQGGGPLERSEGGLGIGLTLVKRLVEMHAGSVAVESAGAGQGSEFLVRLPLAAPPAEVAPAPAHAPRPSVRALRVLVIDDNEDSAESTAMLLRVGGHGVRTATSGTAGLVEFERFAPELVLCDIGMPDLSGFEVARRMRALARGRAVLLVAMTGFGSRSDRAASAEAGFDRHHVKPLDPRELTAIVREAAERDAPAL